MWSASRSQNQWKMPPLLYSEITTDLHFRRGRILRIAEFTIHLLNFVSLPVCVVRGSHRELLANLIPMIKTSLQQQLASAWHTRPWTSRPCTRLRSSRRTWGRAWGMRKKERYTALGPGESQSEKMGERYVLLRYLKPIILSEKLNVSKVKPHFYS